MSNGTELTDFLKREAASLRRGATVLLVVGIIVVVVIVGYFGYILGYLQEKWEAKGFVELALHQATQALEQGRPQLETWVINELPGLMDQAKDSLVKHMPDARKKAEEVLSGAADDLADKIREQASDQVNDILLRHGTEIRLALEAAGDIQKSEDAKEDLKKVLEEEFEALAVRDLDPYLPQYLQALEDMDKELAVVVETPVENLTEEQRLERELIQIVYTLIERTYARLRGVG